MDSKTIVLTPILSEKAYSLSQTLNTYMFAIDKSVNKHTVARAVSAQFDVTVTKVNITNIAGKPKRTVRKTGRAADGYTSDTHKAYVTLKEGDSLPIFAALEEEAAQAEQAAKPSKKGKE